MSDFWSHLAPFLIMAVLLPAAIVLSLWLMPSHDWAERVIQGWANSQGLRVAAIDDSRRYYRLSSLSVAYRLRVVNRKGRERECKAVVGRFLLGQTYRNIAITWTKAP